MTTPRVKLANDAVTTLEVVSKKACSTSNLKSDIQIKIKLTKVSLKQDWLKPVSRSVVFLFFVFFCFFFVCFRIQDLFTEFF